MATQRVLGWRNDVRRPVGPSREDPICLFDYIFTDRRRTNSAWSACLVRARDDDWLYPASSPHPRGGRGTWLQCSVVTAKQGGSCYTLPLSLSLLSDFRHPLISNSALSSFYAYVHNPISYVCLYSHIHPLCPIFELSINIVSPLHTSQLPFFFPSNIVVFLFFLSLCILSSLSCNKVHFYRHRCLIYELSSFFPLTIVVFLFLCAHIAVSLFHYNPTPSNFVEISLSHF